MSASYARAPGAAGEFMLRDVTVIDRMGATLPGDDVRQRLVRLGGPVAELSVSV